MEDDILHGQIPPKIAVNEEKGKKPIVRENWAITEVWSGNVRMLLFNVTEKHICLLKNKKVEKNAWQEQMGLL